MKKLSALLLAVLMVLTLVTACGQKPEPDPSKDADVSVGTSVDDNSEETPDMSTEDTEDTDTTDSTKDATDTTEGTGDDTTTTTDDGKVTQSTIKSTTKSSDKTDNTTKSTTKSSGKTDKTTKSTTKSTDKTTKSTTKSSTTKSTTVSTTKTTTTTVSTTTTTRFIPGFNTTSSSGGGLTTTSKVDNKGYEFDPGDEWELFWNDEFDGTELDKNKWNVESGVSGDLFCRTKENVSVQSGALRLAFRRENIMGKQYSAASVTTARKFSFQYGRLEFRARLPYGQGAGSALWTMGDSYLDAPSDELGWPVCGEIDVMEACGAGTDANKYDSLLNYISTCNLHWGADRDNERNISTTRNRADEVLADAYHIYAVEWDEEKIKFYFDDHLIREMSLDDPTMLDSFHQKHWLVISTRPIHWGDNPIDETCPLPQYFYVDYVRVYKQK